MKISVRVVPRASRDKIEQCPQGLKVYLTKPAIKGEANKQLLKILSSYLKVKKSSLAIVKGLTSRDKVIEIT